MEALIGSHEGVDGGPGRDAVEISCRGAEALVFVVEEENHGILSVIGVEVLEGEDLREESFLHDGILAREVLEVQEGGFLAEADSSPAMRSDRGGVMLFFVIGSDLPDVGFTEDVGKLPGGERVHLVV